MITVGFGYLQQSWNDGIRATIISVWY